MSGPHDTLVATGGAIRAPDPIAFTRGTAIGRYLVLNRVGAGGMGVVYAAWDPELNRKIALKVLRGDASYHGSQAPSQRARLLREAQAMASVQHPNVIAVYDVGEHEGAVFLAMEFIEGVTLREWLEKAPPLEEVLDVLDQAGRGLAAAHEKGLVHRDFKPDNVMVGDDGRVRTLDFGLVQAARIPEPEELLSTDANPVQEGVTQHGELLGTPGYMSPEQYKGEPLDARSDQFSFCVTAYRALYGSAPFAGESIAALSLAVTEGQILDPPDGAAVPAFIRNVLLRGLKVEPQLRYPTMREVLAALREDPSRRRRQWAVRGLVAAAVTAGAFALWQRETGPAVCSGFGDDLVGVWDPSQKEALGEAFRGTGLVYSEDALKEIEKTADRWAAEWVAGRTDACEANHVRGEQSPELMDRRMACYQDSRREIAAFLAILADPDAKSVERSVSGLHRLVGLERCSDAGTLLAGVAPPSDVETRDAVERIHDEIAQARALTNAGRPQEALSLLADVAVEANEIGYPPIAAKAARALGNAREAIGEYDSAQPLFLQAYRIAIEVGDDTLAASIALDLQYLIGNTLRLPEQTEVWELHALAWCRATGDMVCEAGYHNNTGSVDFSAGRYEDAKAHHEQALDIVMQEFGPDHYLVDTAVTNLANDLHALGKFDESITMHERVLRSTELRTGPSHPYLAAILTNMGAVVAEQGKAELAVDYYLRALPIREAALSIDDPEVATTLNNLGNALANLGRYDEAQQHLERALEIRREKLGPDHPWLAATLHNLGSLASQRGRYEEAYEHQLEALAVVERSMGADHPKIGLVCGALGTTLASLERWAEAVEMLDRAIAIQSKSLAPDHPANVLPLVVRARGHRELGDRTAALVDAESAHRIASDSEAGATPRADAALVLADLLWDASTGKAANRRRATEVVTSTRAALAEDDGAQTREAAESLDEWLRTHPS